MNELIFEQLKQVRDSGKTNMLQWDGVYGITWDDNLYELMAWMEHHNSTEYFHMLTGEFSEWLESEGES